MFLTLDLADVLELEVDATRAAAPRLELEPPRADVPAGRENLALRAVEAFCAAAGLQAAVTLRLEKQIPAAAGLGGGSSDAGAVLRGLAQQFPAGVTPAALERLALALGADVPFFLSPGPARVGGIGEERQPLGTGLPSLDLLLANPGVPLATAAVFGAYAEAPGRGAGPLAPDLAAALKRPQPPQLALLARNDLEAAAERLCPALAPLRQALREAGALAVGLSGSGATLYGLFGGSEAAEAARETLRGRTPAGTWLRVARTDESR